MVKQLRLTEQTFYRWRKEYGGIRVDYGHSASHCKLGLFYFNGIETPPDLVEAHRLFLSAARKGDVDARGSVAQMNWHGEGTAMADFETMNWYQKAADQGSQLVVKALEEPERYDSQRSSEE